MKQSPFSNQKIDRCFFCDYKIINGKYNCKKYGHEADNLTQLFSQCRLPEVKEIKVWFEPEPKLAGVLDLCVFCVPAVHTSLGLIPPLWTVRVKIFSRAWIQIAGFPEKAQAEAFIGCKIPE